MPPRKTTDFTSLFAALVEDLRIQVVTSVDRTLGEFGRRLARLERRLEQIDAPAGAAEPALGRRICALCARRAVARGLCSAHYQQWRYRERKARPSADAGAAPVDGRALMLPSQAREVSADN